MPRTKPIPMKNNKEVGEKYTSIELSKKLAENGCKLDSEMFHIKTVVNGEEYWELKEGNIKNLEMFVKSTTGELSIYKDFLPAYDILNDICVKYAKEFFGRDSDDNAIHGVNIMSLMQDNKTQEAEDYIWEHCLFNPTNSQQQ